MHDRHSPLVLIVDDYQDAREMYAEYLMADGFDVAQASNGIEALTRAGELRPDVILMDLALPGIDGWEATRRLKADRRTAAIPVIVLSGRSDDAAPAAAHQAGCAAFLLKPVLPDDLAVEIRKALTAMGDRAAQGSRHVDRRYPDGQV